VSWQSPSLPTISHLPVTVTGAFESLVVDALGFELAGLAGAAGLLAGALELLTLTLPLHDAQATPTIRTNIQDRAFISYLLLNCA
jgi:hypothetical protein